MSQQKAQLISPIDTFTTPGLNVTGVVTSTSFVGSGGTASGLSGTPNITAGIVTATTLYGDGSQLTGASTPAFVGQSTTSQSPTTTIDLSLGNVVYFTHDTNTTVAFANTATTEKVKFIRTKDDTATARSITWPDGFIWDGGSPPTLTNNPRTTDAQVFSLITRDSGTTWYGWEEFNYDPQTASLYSWGSNQSGQLGQTDRTQYSSPVQIPGTSWSFIATGRTSLNAAAIKTDKTLWAWGSNYQGQLGQNDQAYRSSPVQIPGTQWSFVSGGGHILSTKTDNTLWTIGNNFNGELGQNNRIKYSSPVQIPGTQWSSIDAGGSHSLATKTDGTLWSWGYNTRGELGQNNRTRYSSPVQIPGTQWNLISSTNHTLATKTDGTLWSWGYNGAGQLGQNNITNYSSPIQIPGTSWSSVDCGDFFSLATKTDGTLWAWGRNADGQLGQNDTTNYSSPRQIPGNSWNLISGGADHTLSTKNDGTLWAWGTNVTGMLGQSNTTPYSSPVQITGTSWNLIRAGSFESLALQLSS